MGSYILSMSCISNDEVQVAIHRYEDIFRWLTTLDHEGSNWTVVQHVMDGDVVMETNDLTDQVMQEYGNR